MVGRGRRGEVRERPGKTRSLPSPSREKESVFKRRESVSDIDVAAAPGESMLLIIAGITGNHGAEAALHAQCISLSCQNRTIRQKKGLLRRFKCWCAIDPYLE